MNLQLSDELLLENQDKNQLAELALTLVAREFSISTETLKGDLRLPHLNRARLVALYLLVNQVGLSSLEAGKLVGHREQSTVTKALQKIKFYLLDETLGNRYRSILARVWVGVLVQATHLESCPFCEGSGKIHVLNP